VIEHVPGASSATSAPDKVQTAAVVDEKVTGKLELAVALMAIGAEPNATLARGENAIVWLASC